MNRVVASISGALVLGSLLAPPASASTEAEWQALRTAVEAACTSAASVALDDVAAKVDPFGSESYGLALMSGIEKGTRTTRSMICVYDKQSKRAEVGTPIDLENAKDALADFPVGNQASPAGTAATLIYPGSATCGQDCLAHWVALSSDDQNQLILLPEQVRRTLAEAKPGSSESADIVEARAAARSIIAAAGGQPDGQTAKDMSTVATGKRTCTLYRFGYMGESAGKVGGYPCEIAALPGGGANLTMSSQDSRVYQVQLLANGMLIVGGRSAPSGPPPGGYDLAQPVDPVDPNYGNEVGLGIARSDGRLFLASIDERGMQPPDPNYFEMLVVGSPGRK